MLMIVFLNLLPVPVHEFVQVPLAENASQLRVFLACGFTPLHLKTFLSAQLRNFDSARRVELNCGLCGDLAGILERLRAEEHDALAVVIEWSDLDSRLGLRNLGGWQVDKLPDIANSVSRSLELIARALQGILSAIPTCVRLPTLPLPPLFYPGRQHTSLFESSLRWKLAHFAEGISIGRQVSVVIGQSLDEDPPPSGRFGRRTDLAFELYYDQGNLLPARL